MGDPSRKHGGPCGRRRCVVRPAAQAHGESSPFIRAVVDRVDPPAAGLSITTFQATATLLQVRNHTPRDLEVLSDRGEPFLRIGRDGVFANVSSREWYASGNPDGAVALDVRTGGPPRWARVSADPGSSWFDHRLHPRTLTAVPPPTERRTVRLFDWTVPVRIGGWPAAVEGSVEWSPALGSVVPALTNRPDRSTGVRVAITTGPVPGMFLANTGSRPVTVRGREGEPFLRFTRERGPRPTCAALATPTAGASKETRSRSPPTPEPGRGGGRSRPRRKPAGSRRARATVPGSHPTTWPGGLPRRS